jgi:hypothetical protein
MYKATMLQSIARKVNYSFNHFRPLYRLLFSKCLQIVIDIYKSEVTINNM